jgi:hypothetical protein
VNTFREVFPGRHVFLVVVHAESKLQVLNNIGLAKQEGADGVFLINHSVSHRELFEYYEIASELHPNFWMGLNCLDLGRRAVGVIPKSTRGLWVDDAGVDESGTPVFHAQQFATLRVISGWKGIYFGGVAFKHQRIIVDVAKTARLAALFVDVVTTSGPATGKAADPQKIRTMKEAIGNHPLAIASGITPENVAEYMPYADCFMVATGISHSHTELNPERVRALAKALGK